MSEACAFSFAGVRIVVVADTCAPVRMIGLPRFSHMKDRAEAVYAIVSVP